METITVLIKWPHKTRTWLGSIFCQQPTLKINVEEMWTAFVKRNTEMLRSKLVFRGRYQSIQPRDNDNIDYPLTMSATSSWSVDIHTPKTETVFSTKFKPQSSSSMIINETVFSVVILHLYLCSWKRLCIAHTHVHKLVIMRLPHRPTTETAQFQSKPIHLWYWFAVNAIFKPNNKGELLSNICWTSLHFSSFTFPVMLCPMKITHSWQLYVYNSSLPCHET